MKGDASGPDRYRPGLMFYWTVLKSKGVMGFDPVTGELRYADPDYVPPKALVQPTDPLDPYSLGEDSNV